MTEGSWISAIEALRQYDRAVPSKVGGGPRPIARLAHGGVVRSRARVFIRRGPNRQEERFENAELPAQFWWANGELALEADWDIGTFSTFIDNSFEWKAFGVEFHQDDLLHSLPSKPVPNGFVA